METNVARNLLWATLLKTPHRKLEESVSPFQKALQSDPDFTSKACLAMTMRRFNQIRDLGETGIITLLMASSKQGLSPSAVQLLRRNGRYLFNSLEPYRVIRVDDFIDQNRKKNNGLAPNRHSRKASEEYLKGLWSNESRFIGAYMRNKAGIRRMILRYHLEHPKWVDDVVFKGLAPEGSQLELLKKLSELKDIPNEQALLIAESKLPMTALTSVIENPNPALIAALVSRMTAQEAANSRAWLEREGWLDTQEILDLYLTRLGSSDKVSAPSLEHRASSQGTNKAVEDKLAQVAAKVQKNNQIADDTGVIVDISGSMELTIETTIVFGNKLSDLCTGRIEAVGVNETARPINLKKGWKGGFDLIRAQGGTALGAGLVYFDSIKFYPRRIVILTDDEENRRSEE